MSKRTGKAGESVFSELAMTWLTIIRCGSAASVFTGKMTNNSRLHLIMSQNFYSIYTPLPPMLLEMSGVTSDARFIGMFYEGSKAVWSDGRASATFNFYNCWQILSSHPAIRFPLAIAVEGVLTEEGCLGGLGSDDCPATHLLLLDTVAKTMAIAPWKEGHRWLNAQHPPLPPSTPEQIAAERAAVLALLKNLDINPSLEELNKHGMFELFTQPDPQLVQQGQELAAFLNQHLDPRIKEALEKFNL